jgi:hypothetical protein
MSAAQQITIHQAARALIRGLASKGVATLAENLVEKAQAAESEAADSDAPIACEQALADRDVLQALADAVEDLLPGVENAEAGIRVPLYERNFGRRVYAASPNRGDGSWRLRDREGNVFARADNADALRKEVRRLKADGFLVTHTTTGREAPWPPR